MTNTPSKPSVALTRTTITSSPFTSSAIGGQRDMVMHQKRVARSTPTQAPTLECLNKDYSYSIVVVNKFIIYIDIALLIFPIVSFGFALVASSGR